jgi:hypothetical protein
MHLELPLEPDSTECEEEIMDLYLDLYIDDSKIDGDCNESQPCRGDEDWLPEDLD